MTTTSSLPASPGTGSTPDELRLVVSAGPPLQDIVVTSAGAVLGRSAQCDAVLPDPAVSRRHARVERFGGNTGDWFAVDLGSRHGTFVNGVPIAEGVATPLQAHDRLRLGPWELRVDDTESQFRPGTTLASFDEDTGDAASVTVVPADQLGALAQHRLDELMRLSRTLQAVTADTEVGEIAANALLAGTQLTRAALVRPGEATEQIEALGVAHREGAEPMPGPMRISRSVVRAAATAGEPVRLQEGSSLAGAASIMSMGITRAVCAPVRVGDLIEAFAYADSRKDGVVHAEELTYCAAVADLCGLALANLRRSALELRQANLIRDLSMARRVQARLAPAPAGSIGGLRYASHASAGRHVAGDFLVVTPIAERRTAVVLGDVSGKGLAAGLLMATIQSHFEALLFSGEELGDAVTKLNAYIHKRSALGEFATMIAAVFDLAAGTLEIVDAGHGLGFVRRGSGETTILRLVGGVPVGVMGDSLYNAERIDLDTGARLVLVSDGVREQAAPSGEEFGVQRIIDAVTSGRSPQSDADGVRSSLLAHAGGRSFDDDVTIVSAQIEP